MDNVKIDTCLVQKLIAEQLPQWQSLPIYPVVQSGWDNRTFHLGEEMVIRLPSAQEYEPQIEKEYKWLPWLSKQLSFQITQPIALGKPSSTYPWHWSINRWIEGESASRQNIHDMKSFAKALGKSLKELQSLNSTGGPAAGAHNFYRGGFLNAYDHEMQLAIPKIKNAPEQNLAASLWQQAISSEWQVSPVWVHGDIAVGNILVRNGRFHALIDFGQLAIGDPACDLAIAWNLFSAEERSVFKDAIQLDKHTWVRALGWAFWKTLCWPIKGTDIKAVLGEIYTDYNVLK
ncbi:aminoglycoside phosphotransferase family protein [Legionella micdadei]|uniref:Aminoglycoside phosphotransferase n=1 Tax=Legionella micdadei TaxID=451 RepID=A0A098GHJ4_LEGMI|nr:aminoglycoside phosphotransferase family protein [Legionella micdadei]ARG97094.1 acetyltransferase [Legionella micdadei]KTD29313.1 aminoglycoside 3-N-acetyltransferase [Legionella micdadei]NSL19625.1 aminoglycoside phosphotransferase family protein [Legionella micdadei]CEG61470.1 Aminoglycoside phosphotransferase [Legionella micdadei]SCY41913.1 Predicted kinase, aminoglycoside phosphotransferase (APT) family [Legionella micdadei]